MLDTPGYLDFTGETLSAVRVADAAIIVVSATSGVEVGTERVWEYCEDRGIPRIFFISMMDKEHADLEGVLDQIKTRLSERALPAEIPVGQGPGFEGIINLFSQRAHIFKKGATKGEYEDKEIPEDLQDRASQWATELQETLATTDEALLDSYLDAGSISPDEAVSAMCKGMASKEVFPVLCGSATLTYGMRTLLDKVVELCPDPASAGVESFGETEIVATDDGPLASLVFKTVAEPHLSLIHI